MANGLLGMMGQSRQPQQAQGLLGSPFAAQPTRQQIRGRLFSDITGQFSQAGPQAVAGSAIGAGLGLGIASALGRQFPGEERANVIRQVQQEAEQSNIPLGPELVQFTASRLQELGHNDLALEALMMGQQMFPEPEMTAEQRNLASRAELAGLVPGSPEYQQFMLTGGEGFAEPANLRTLRARAQEAGLQPGTPEYSDFMLTGGQQPTTVINLGQDGTPLPAEPTGWIYARDEQGQVIMEPDPTGRGMVPRMLRTGPEAAEEARRQEASALQQQLTQRQLNPTLDDIRTAENLASARTMGFIPRTGMFSPMLRFIPGAGQASVDLEATVEAIGAGISLENLNQMRQASPTGGALGNVTERQQALLASAFGSLDTRQSTPLFLYNLARVENTLNDIVHGPDAGPERHDMTQMRQRLNREYGITEDVPEPVQAWTEEEIARTDAGISNRFEAMGAQELQGVNIGSLSDEELQQFIDAMNRIQEARQ